MHDPAPDPSVAPTGRLGDLLRQRRRERGLTLQRVADEVGCAPSYLSAIETGRKGPPSDRLLRRLEGTLEVRPGELLNTARWDRAPDELRSQLAAAASRGHGLTRSVAELYRLLAEGRFEDARRAAARLAPAPAAAPEAHGPGLTPTAEPPDHRTASGSEPGRSAGSTADADPPPGSPRPGAEPAAEPGAEPGSDRPPAPPAIGLIPALPVEVPVINRVAAGYPRSFTDLGYPARIADEYIRAPDLHDPDAFAARVVGDSMLPEYREGDVVIFSPMREVTSGCDAFVRLDTGASADGEHETTFKRIYFEPDDQGRAAVRLQPLNPEHPARTVPAEHLAGLYRAVSVIRAIG